jgi:hypothetical protein
VKRALVFAIVLTGCEGNKPSVSTPEPAPSASARIAPPPTASSAAGPPPSIREVLAGTGDLAAIEEAATNDGQPFDGDRRRRLRVIAVRPKVKIGDAKAASGLMPEVVTRQTSSIRGRLRACYWAVLNADPDVEGTIVFSLSIDKAGAVTRAKASPGANSALADCAVTVFKSLSFPEPEGGKAEAKIEVTFSNDQAPPPD